MNISSMLARLQANLGVPHLAEQLLLIPPCPHHFSEELCAINLLVGYSNSENSQAALDLTLWIALQTRLATNKPVTVQVAYVTEEISSTNSPSNSVSQSHNTSKPFHANRRVKTVNSTTKGGTVATLPSAKVAAQNRAEQFEQADRILWQARSLATEWRGSLKTHLRFGDVAVELGHVARAEAATLLILGCASRDDSLIQRLGSNFPCAVLGIPEDLEVTV